MPHRVMETFHVERDDVRLAAQRWPGGDRTIVLLHEGVADLRGWAETAALLAPEVTVVAYDRRGHGQTPAGTGPFSHLDDLFAVLDVVDAGPVWLVGASAGGGLAIDATLSAPHRVSGLVVMGTAVSGAPEPELDEDTKRLEPLLERAYDAHDADEINRLETWIWLDGPAQPEGRVTGAARALAIDMNAIIIASSTEESAEATGIDAWHRLNEIRVPVTVLCGDLDVPFIVTRCREIAARIPSARYRELTGMAHQPYLESPAAVAGLIRDALTGR